MKHFSYDVTNDVCNYVSPSSEKSRGVILAVVIGITLAATLFFNI